MGKDISSPFWVRVAAVRSVGARNNFPIRRGIFYWLCSKKNCVKLSFSNWWLSEELALLKSSPVAVEDDKKMLITEKVPLIRQSHMFFPLELFLIWGITITRYCSDSHLWQCKQLSGTFLHQRPLSYGTVEVWDVMCNSLGLQSVIWPKKNILRYSLKEYNSVQATCLYLLGI